MFAIHLSMGCSADLGMSGVWVCSVQRVRCIFVFLVSEICGKVRGEFRSIATRNKNWYRL